MKRDCGEGELVPVKWEVVSCEGENDNEATATFNNFDDAKSDYDVKKGILEDVPCSDVRLYALDRKGYANCILSWIHDKSGSIRENDRTKELWPQGHPHAFGGSKGTGNGEEPVKPK